MSGGYLGSSWPSRNPKGPPLCRSLPPCAGKAGGYSPLHLLLYRQEVAELRSFSTKGVFY